MSSLIFYTDPAQALVVTDTLSADSQGVPLLFCSKALYVPHLRMIVAGTGVGGFSDEWAMKANRGTFRGIENLNQHAPEALQVQWSEFQQKLTLAGGMTTTVYVFGVSEVNQSIVIFAYRSSNSFASERLSYGTGVKPACTVPAGDLMEHVEAMMMEQRELQAAERFGDRVHIGGEAVAMHLTPDGCNTWSMFRFGDYAQQLRIMLDNRRANQKQRG